MISVIVPVYNVDNYLSRCIESILNQSEPDFVLILVDDGSTDTSGAICDNYAEKDKRIHVIHKENGGLSDARNKGVDWSLINSKSEWITFIDSDDWIHPEYLNFLLSAAISSNVDISVCRYEEKNEFSEYDHVNNLFDVYDTEDLYVNQRVNMVVAWGKLYKKVIFQNLRFPYGKLNEDEFTTYKALFQYKRIAFLDNALYFYFQNPKSIMQSKWTKGRLDSIEAISNQIPYFKNMGLKKAYSSSAKSLMFSCAKAAAKLREFYPEDKRTRLQYINKYYCCKFRYFGRFLTQEDKKMICKYLHPTWFSIKKRLKKIKSNIIELLF